MIHMPTMCIFLCQLNTAEVEAEIRRRSVAAMATAVLLVCVQAAWAQNDVRVVGGDGEAERQRVL